MSIAIILFFLYRIILYSVMGVKGSGYFGMVADWYYLILLCAVFCIPAVVSHYMRPHIEANEYKNAQNVFRGAMSVMLVIGGGLGILMFLLSGILAGKLYGLSEMGQTFRILAVIIPISNVLGVYRGALKARKLNLVILCSVVLEQLVVFVVSMVAVHAHKQSSPQSICSSMMVALLAGAGVSLLFTFAMYDGMRAKRLREIRKDETVAYVSEAVSIRRIVRDYLPMVFCLGAEFAGSAVGILAFNIVSRFRGYTESIRVEMLGVYTGIFRLMLMIPVVIVMRWCIHNLDHTTADIQNSEDCVAYIQRLIRLLVLVAIPFVFGLYIIEESIMSRFFLSNSELGEKFLQFGAPLILVLAVTYGTVQLMLSLKLRKSACLNLLIAFGAQIVAAVLLLGITNMNIYALLYSSYVFATAAMILNFRTLGAIYRIPSRWVRNFVLPLFAAIIMSVLMWIIFHLLVVITHMEGLSMIVSIIAAIAIYLVAAFYLDMISEADLMLLPGGERVIGFCKKVHIM